MHYLVVSSPEGRAGITYASHASSWIIYHCIPTHTHSGHYGVRARAHTHTLPRTHAHTHTLKGMYECISTCVNNCPALKVYLKHMDKDYGPLLDLPGRWNLNATVALECEWEAGEGRRKSGKSGREVTWGCWVWVWRGVFHILRAVAFLGARIGSAAPFN